MPELPVTTGRAIEIPALSLEQADHIGDLRRHARALGSSLIRTAGISQILLPLAVGVAMVGVLYLFVYSYLAWREDPERIPPAGTLPAEQ